MNSSDIWERKSAEQDDLLNGRDEKEAEFTGECSLIVLLNVPQFAFVWLFPLGWFQVMRVRQEYDIMICVLHQEARDFSGSRF